MPPNVSLVIPELPVLAPPKGEAKGDDGFEAALAAMFIPLVPIQTPPAPIQPEEAETRNARSSSTPAFTPDIDRPGQFVPESLGDDAGLGFGQSLAAAAENHLPNDHSTEAALTALAAMFIPLVPIQTPPPPIQPEEAETRNVRSSVTPAFTPDVDRRGKFVPESSGDDAGLGFGQSLAAAAGKEEAGPAFRADSPGDESVPLPAAQALPEAKGFVAALTPTLDPTPVAADKSTVVKPESPPEAVKQEGTASKLETYDWSNGRPVAPASQFAEPTPDPKAPVEGAALPTTPRPPSNEKPLAETAGVAAEVTSRAGGEQGRVDRSAVEKLVRKPTTGNDEAPMPPASPTPPAAVKDAAVEVRQAETTPIARLPEPLRLMVMTVRGAVGRGEHEVKLQLQPESLGRVEARLSYGDGEVRIHLAADSAQTSALLQSHTSDLRAALAGAGLAVGRLDVTVSDGRPQSRPPFFERDETAARREPAQPSAPPSVTAAKSSKIDYRV